MARDAWLGRKPRWRGRGTGAEPGDYTEEWRRRQQRRFGREGREGVFGYDHPYRGRRTRWEQDRERRYGSPSWLGRRGYGREYRGWYDREYGRPAYDRSRRYPRGRGRYGAEYGW